MAERLIEANGVELCTEPFGDRGDPPLLLIMGTGASMLWWEEGFCRLLADGGRYAIRYDHRDTGRSTAYPPGRPGYGGAELTADAAGVLDAYAIDAAHLVGVSAGGGIAQELAVAAPERVLSLTLISTSPALATEGRLPGPTDEFMRFAATARVDWSDPQSIVDYQVDYARLLAGGERQFDEAGFRALVRSEVERARDPAAVQNHDLLAHDEGPGGRLSSISAPTLVIHGSADPMFPLAHGEALAEEIPGARLLELEGAGHGVFRSDWEAIARAIIEHTSGAGTRNASTDGSMSSDNVELVRSVFEAFNRRDWERWESHHHHDVKWIDPPEVPDGGVHRGVAEIRRFLDELLSVGDDWHVEVMAIEAVGPDRVLMRGQSVLTGTTSGIHLEDPLLQLFEIEDGRVRRVRTFRSEEEALRAAGLSD